jgi:hypothetical protein
LWLLAAARTATSFFVSGGVASAFAAAATSFFVSGGSGFCFRCSEGWQHLFVRGGMAAPKG